MPEADRTRDIPLQKDSIQTKQSGLSDAIKNIERYKIHENKEINNRREIRGSQASWFASESFKRWARVGIAFAGLAMLSQTAAARTNEIGSTLTIHTENSPAQLHMDMSPSHRDESFKLPQSALDPIVDRLYKQFQEVYPKLQRWSAPDAPHKDIHLDFDPTIGNHATANAQSMHITINSEYLKNNPAHTEGVFTHELTHLIQNYPDHQYDSATYLVEGIADYARYKYGPKNDGWTLPRLEPGHMYNDSYKVTARFLVWMEEKKSGDIVNDLNHLLQKGQFSDEAFVQWTGQTVNELWAEYSHEQFAKQEQEQKKQEWEQKWNRFYKPLIISAAKSYMITSALGVGLALAVDRVLKARGQEGLFPSNQQDRQPQQAPVGVGEATAPQQREAIQGALRQRFPNNH